MEKRTINVLIVDDSKVAQELLSYIIESDPELKVIGVADNGEQALQWLKKHTADVITMDIQMPAINGFEVTKRIMETNPVPIVIITSGYTKSNTEMAFRSVEVGALAILEKPVGPGDISYSSKAKEIVNTIKVIAGIKLIKKRAPPLIGSLGQDALSQIRKEKIQKIKAVAIGASLGGPLAIAEILSQLPPSFPVPIFIVQHILSGFTEGFISWLQKYCTLSISLAHHGEEPIAGHAYVAPDGYQMEISRDNFFYLNASSSNGPQPSVGRLFLSMAQVYGPHGIGVILTGMGRDGAKELLLMKQQGAYTIAQDKESCIMFGMPHEAIEIGAVCQVLPLNKIAQALIYLTGN